ncbi:MAG: FKBP-type peptidyl-prolyl cis-trans isomerase [Pseudomonadota bacterium]|nr:FKBP-type peptidyl-prolyl cis-trans isomerase [Pseudomonadota bacterium]
MRKRHLVMLACICALSLNVSAEEAVKLDTDREKLSYAIGVQVAQSLASQEVDLDARAFSLAIEDMIAGREPRIPREEFQALLEKQRATMLKAQQEKSKKNLEESKAFLTANRKKEGVKELPSGLQYRVVKDGAGDQPKSTDTVSVHYRGTLIDGREFDSSTRAGQPAVFQVNGVIKGWQEALPLMKTGAKWQLFIPPGLAYGERGAGGAIGPNETLIFDIDLLAVNPAKK